MQKLCIRTLKSFLICVLSILAMVVPANAAEKVVLQLRWDHQFQFAGYYAALWQGYYANAGLDVDIRSAFTKDWNLRNSLVEVAEQRADFGIGSSDLLISREKYASPVVLASFFQESPLTIYGLKGVKLDAPGDLKGLNLGLFLRGNIGDIEVKMMLSRAGLDPERDFPRVTLIKKGLKDITDGRVDVAIGYSTELSWFEHQTGKKLTVLKPSTYGVNSYGDSLFTRRSLVEQKPEMVQAFVEATIQGWRYALLNGEEIADRITRDLPRKIPVADLKAFNRSQIKPVIQLLHFPLVPLGHSDPGRWRQIHAAISKIGVDAGAPPGDDFVYDPEREAGNQRRTMIFWVIVTLYIATILAVIAWIVLLRRTVTARTLALSTSEKHYRNLVETSHDLIWAVDEKGCFTFVNRDGVKSILGYEPEEMIGKSLAFFKTPEQAKKDLKTFEKMKETGTLLNYETAYRAKDGSFVPMNFNALVVRDDDDNFVGTTGTAQDITERKQAEEKLRESKERFRSVIDNSPMFISLKDRDGRYKLANQGHADLFGIDPLSVIGKRISEVLHKKVAIDSAAQERKVMETKAVVVEERTVITKRGSFDFLITKFPIFDASGAVKEVGTIGTDITDRKQMEDRLRGAVESLQEGFALFDADDRLVAFNDVYRRINMKSPAFIKTGIRFEDLIRVKVESGMIVDAIGREEEFIRERMKQHHNPGLQIMRQHNDGRWDIIKETRTPEGGVAITFSDITDLMQVEESLRTSEARLSGILDIAPEAVITIDDDMNIRLFNKGAARIFGYKAKDVLGRPLNMLMPKRLRKGHEKHIKGFENSPEDYRLMDTRQEITGLRKNGTEFPATASVSKLEVGGEKMFTVVLRDITQRKRAEVALRDSEAHSRAIIESTPGTVVIRNLEGHNLIVNDEFADWHTVDRDEIIGKTMFDYLPPQIFDEIAAQEREVIETKKTVEAERRVTFQDGVTRDIFSQKFPIFNSDGDCVAIGTIGTDITERKQTEEALRVSENRFRAFLDNSPSSILIKDAEGKYLVANTRWHTWFNPDGQDIAGKTVFDFYPEDHAIEITALEHKVLQTGKAIESDSKVKLSDGMVVTTNLQKFPIFDEDGKIVAIGGVRTDITDRIKTEEVLRQSQKMEAVGQLTGGVAHDFNNLLSVINGSLELTAEASGLDDETREMLHQAMAAVDHGAKLTDQLLSFSRLKTLNPETIEANTLLFDTIGLLKRTLGENIDIKTTFDMHVPLIKVDTVMLETAILNMAFNARDAMPSGGTLTITTAGVELNGDVLDDDQIPLTGPHALISVSDTGTGIKKKDLDHVFEPFFTTKGVGEGTGMGMSMVYGFVKQSGGHVTIDSKRGKGTTINLYFPATVSLDTKVINKGATRPEADPTGTETILVVEDDEGVRQVTMKMLSRLGYVVLEAEDGPSALRSLKALKERGVGIDLVVSDVIMPASMNGVELADELRRHYQDIKVLMTSGYPDRVIEKSGFDDSGIPLLRKPYKKTDLADAVRRVLDQ